MTDKNRPLRVLQVIGIVCGGGVEAVIMNYYRHSNAIDLNRYAYDEAKRTRLRAELGISEGALVVGHVGRFAYQKNHEFLLAVFAEVLKSRPDAHLVLIGTGELESATRASAAKLGIVASTHFLGLRTDAYDYYSVMDAFVFPSRFEGLGLVAIEAQASGLPALCSTAVPPEAIILDTASSLDLAAGPAAWADAIIVATSAPRIAAEIAREKLAPYDITAEAEGLMDFYKAL